MRPLVCFLLLSLTACGNQPTGSRDFFARQDRFAADRARQTTLVDLADTQEACVQVVNVLMDLNCSLVEVDSRLGLVAGGSNAKLLAPPGGKALAVNQDACVGRRVTVSVVPSGNDRVAIRAAFRPVDARADETFRILLHKSLTLSAQPGVPR